MLANFHTHTSFCDGENTPEEMVKSAIDKGFLVLGFSGHSYTEFEYRACMHDTSGYIDEIKRLKEKYKDKIQIYLGIEEDAFTRVRREDFDYLIGSCHFFCEEGKYYSIDFDHEHFKTCLDVFKGDIIKLSRRYYENFCTYIKKRKPDIIGHFDLITKFDEIDTPMFLCNKEYNKLAESYLKEALKSECIFEINTGAISRGYRTCPYPSQNLLYILKENDAKIILSSDSHAVDTLDCKFEETKKKLLDIGFKHRYILYDGEFKKIGI